MYSPIAFASSFQSRAGFSAFCDVSTNRNPTSRRWFQSRAGFSAFCDPVASLCKYAQNRFNPVLGFLPSATDERPTERPTERQRFNPVLGFLPSATVGVATPDSPVGRFNPVLGFLPSATRQLLARRIRGRVSIPCWVFCLLRLCRPWLRVADEQVSIPCWVFCLLRRSRVILESADNQVSIPCWVFCLLRRGTKPHRIESRTFQSRAGFSAFCDSLLWRRTNPAHRFNPVLGFLPSATRPSG